LLCVAAVQKINEVFSTVNDEFEEFSYSMKLYRHVTCFLNTHFSLWHLRGIIALNVLTLLVWCQKAHPACKKLSDEVLTSCFTNTSSAS